MSPFFIWCLSVCTLSAAVKPVTISSNITGLFIETDKPIRPHQDTKCLFSLFSPVQAVGRD